MKTLLFILILFISTSLISQVPQQSRKTYIALVEYVSEWIAEEVNGYISGTLIEEDRIFYQIQLPKYYNFDLARSVVRKLVSTYSDIERLRGFKESELHKGRFSTILNIRGYQFGILYDTNLNIIQVYVSLIYAK
jgi:hypothetical protein